MSHELLANIWFLILALVWSLYVIQEAFVVGLSVMSAKYKEEKDVRKINTLVGTHWDGIEVWLVLAVAGQFAAFPVIFAETLTNLYVVFFLLLYIIVARGMAIETLYKTGNKKVQKALKVTWQVSSPLLILVIGVYLTNLFMGLQLLENYIEGGFFHFLYIFNFTAILGGVMFVTYSLTSGYNFLVLNYKNDLRENIEPVGKYASVITVVTLIFILMSLNNEYSVFNSGVYETYQILILLPALSTIMMIASMIFVWLNKNLFSFITQSIGMTLFIFTGFVGSMPYALKSINETQGAGSILMVDGAAGPKTLELMLYLTIAFLPIVLGYIIFKYIKFWGK